MKQSFILIIVLAHVIPTPKPDNNNILFVRFPLSSVAIVKGMETDEVLPNLAIVDGTFEASSFSFFAR